MHVVGKVLFVAGCAGIAVGGIALGCKAKPLTVLESVKGHREWKKANLIPVLLSPKQDVLCRAITQTDNPHYDRYITVFVNPVGEKAMMKGGEFPIGSVIVKQKQENRSQLGDFFMPILLSTVMVKRERGYNPECGDWEFAVINADASATDGEGKLENCMKCHQDRAKQDYVFGSYLNTKQRL